MITEELKLFKAGFTVLRTVKHKTNDILRLKECKTTGQGLRYKYEIISQHPSQAAMYRELKELLKDQKTVVLNENDRDHNDKLVAAGFTIIRLDNFKGIIKQWCSNQAWKTYRKYDNPRESALAVDELLKNDKIITG